MATKQEVEQFLNEFKTKLKSFRLLIWDDRGKNAQALLDLEISPIKRRDFIEALTVADYYQGPKDEQYQGMRPMWVFGKMIKGTEVYIKISMGFPNCEAICISFHIAEHKMTYPYK